jgi:hypothetical protein
MSQKIVLSVLGLIPVALSIGGIAFIVQLVMPLMNGAFDDNPSLKAFSYIAVMFVAVIIIAFMYSAYKIFAYIRNH